jgi:uncharacterized protein DUF3142
MTSASIRFGLLVLVVCVLPLSSIASRSTHAISSRPRQPWKTGYWVWAGESPASARFTPDILYVEVPARRWPHNLPPAAEYIVVQRIETATPLTSALTATITAHYDALVTDAGSGVHIAGLQIDYDSPTRALESYGTFLRQMRERLPPGSTLSITALLDWFDPYTKVASALRWVDEFVPQFYDTVHERTSAGIAQPIDSTRWAPVFNRYRVPYRIGIASFGRIARRRMDASGQTSVRYLRDASPIEFADGSQLARLIRTTVAGELVVRYDVLGPVMGQPELRMGDTLEITLPTEASVSAAYQAARQFGGFCAGVLAFRWPSRSETVTLGPDDVERVASGAPPPTGPTLEVHRAACIERTCDDLYLNAQGQVGSIDRTIGIRTTTPIELFLPDGPLRSTTAHPREILVRLPAFSGLGTFYLGRAISRGPVDFEVFQP